VTPILLAFAAAALQSGPPADAAACTALIRTAPEKAIAAADAWRLRGGGLDARNCLGLAYAAAERWAPAAAAFEQAAREAEGKGNGRSADFWAQSGNAWLAAGNAAAAAKAFDAALATSALQAELRGEVHLDRARAQIALGNAAAARADLDRGLSLVPADPFGWYLSAALARRENALARAQSDIAKAVELAPKEARILLEAGNIAGLSGDLPAARALHARAAQADPGGEAGRAAAAALAANSAPEPAIPAAPAPAPQSR
jgi:tetratricopeptide (TPR) repeat protein